MESAKEDGHAGAVIVGVADEMAMIVNPSVYDLAHDARAVAVNNGDDLHAVLNLFAHEIGEASLSDVTAQAMQVELGIRFARAW
jgi:hypothetical protein